MTPLPRAAVACLPALLAALLTAACGAEGSTTADDPPDPVLVTDGAVEVPAKLSNTQYGIQVAIVVGYDEDRVVSDARLLWDGGSDDDIGLWPLDGSEPDRPPETLDLPTGTEMLLAGNLLAACPDVPDVLVFEVESRIGDDERTDRYLPESSRKLERAFATWCEQPVLMSVTGSRSTPEGDYEVTMEFSNPGPDSATVVSEAVTLGETTWEEGTVEVPAGTRTSMTVSGHGPPECRVTAPWQEGHVLVDGEPIRPEYDDGWC